jgi:MoaA/NifB/PqqE/SkfB family radical SAM enzyme
MDKLAAAVEYSENIGIPCSVITSGVVPDFYAKLTQLIKHGLKSLTMSYDIVPHDSDTKKKSSFAIETLEFFQNNCKNYRDTAAVVTLHRKNYQHLLGVIKYLSEKGIWTFFDLYHYDRGQPGTKVGKLDPELCFKYEEILELVDIIKAAAKMKEQGYLVHASKSFSDILEQPKYQNYRWLCADGDKRETFPSWLTIDCDGSVYPCDDFHTNDFPFKEVNVLNISDHFNLWREWWADEVFVHCSGCLWSTHVDSHAIKEERLKGFIHDDVI